VKTLVISIAAVALLSGCASQGSYQWQGSMLDGAPLLKSDPGTFVTPVCPSVCRTRRQVGNLHVHARDDREGAARH
jgi:hypothetical protein